MKSFKLFFPKVGGGGSVLGVINRLERNARSGISVASFSPFSAQESGMYKNAQGVFLIEMIIIRKLL